MSNQCLVHLVNNCPLCSRGASVPSAVSMELDPEVKALVEQQTAAGPIIIQPSSGPFIVPAPEIVTDPIAVGVLDKAKKYADACQTARKLEDEVGLLKLQLHNATKDLSEAIEIRNAAKKELSKFVE